MRDEDWFWACKSPGEGEGAGDRFVIEDGQDDLWRRVRREIDPNEHCSWNAIHPGRKRANIDNILNLVLIVVIPYGVNYNQFAFEAAKIPVYAKFLREARYGLANYVSNSIVKTAPPYSAEATRKLGRIVSQTLGCDEDWFEA